MIRQLAAAVLVLSLGGGVFVRAQLVGATSPSVTPAGDHPSNGVMELIVTPVPGRPRPHSLTDPPEVYAPWDGLLNVRVRNISLGPAYVEEVDWTREYTIEVLGSSGKSAPLTERGKMIAEAASRPRDPRGYYGPAGAANLAPGDETSVQVNIKQIYEVSPGKAYTIRMKRSAGLPKVDEYGKPLQQRELSCTVTIDERGVVR